MSRVYTTEEVREQFLAHVRALVDYWDGVPKETSKEKLSGLAFSILVLLDGGTELPHFEVVASPHPDDQAYNEENKDDYYAYPPDLENSISGCLHELFYKEGRR
jgi:hypothetical protein